LLIGTILGNAPATDSKEFYGIALDQAAAYALIGFNTRTNDVFAMDNVTFSTAPVVAAPLPGAFALFAAGVAGLGFARRRKRTMPSH
jgi:hypothetical protein